MTPRAIPCAAASRAAARPRSPRRSSGRRRRRAARGGGRGCPWSAPRPSRRPRRCRESRAGGAAETRRSPRRPRPPSVPFLKPTGMESPLAISRWVWLSVVRAPIAAQRDEVREVLGRHRVEHLGRAGQAELVHGEQDAPREHEPVADVAAPVEVRVVDEPLPADGRARLLEVGAHDEDERVAALAARGRRRPAYSRAAAGRGWSRARPRRGGAGVAAVEQVAERARAPRTVSARGASGSSRFSALGGRSGSSDATLRSSIGSLMVVSSSGARGSESTEPRDVGSRRAPGFARLSCR